MISLIALVLAAGQPTAVSRDIDKFCRRSTPCVIAQRRSLTFFLNHWVIFDATEADAERCMRQGKTRGVIDWTVAERCIRAWSKGRRPILPGRPVNNPHN